MIVCIAEKPSVAKDYKRIGEHDTGLNTGGMGSVTPVPFATKEWMQKVDEEIVINTPAPALAHAIYRATGVWHRTVPFTPEKILMGMVDPNWHEKDLRVK